MDEPEYLSVEVGQLSDDPLDSNLQIAGRCCALARHTFLKHESIGEGG